MKERTARGLRPGDCICTDELPVGERHFGIVTQIGYHTITARWDDGKVSVMPFEETKPIERVLCCQNCGHREPQGRTRVNPWGWGPRCPTCREDHLQTERNTNDPQS